MAEGTLISQLPLALPLTGEEFIPIVQNGVTRRINVRVLLSAGFSGADIRQTIVQVQTSGQVVFTLPSDVNEVEQVMVNGQAVSPNSYSFSGGTKALTLTTLPYQLDPADELLVVYSAAI